MGGVGFEGAISARKELVVWMHDICWTLFESACLR